MTFTVDQWHQHPAGVDDIVVHRPWSAADLADARRWRREGYSAAAIGKKLNRSRNSVIGALNRAGEPGVLVNGGSTTGRWSFNDKPPAALPLRLSERERR